MPPTPFPKLSHLPATTWQAPWKGQVFYFPVRKTPYAHPTCLRARQPTAAYAFFHYLAATPKTG